MFTRYALFEHRDEWNNWLNRNNGLDNLCDIMQIIFQNCCIDLGCFLRQASFKVKETFIIWSVVFMSILAKYFSVSSFVIKMLVPL